MALPAPCWIRRFFATRLRKCTFKVLRLAPRHADAHHNLSNALTRLGFYQEALEHNRRALDLAPGHKAALWQRARNSACSIG